MMETIAATTITIAATKIAIATTCATMKVDRNMDDTIRDNNNTSDRQEGWSRLECNDTNSTVHRRVYIIPTEYGSDNNNNKVHAAVERSSNFLFWDC
jgi:hypothetical protein